MRELLEELLLCLLWLAAWVALAWEALDQWAEYNPRTNPRGGHNEGEENG